MLRPCGCFPIGHVMPHLQSTAALRRPGPVSHARVVSRRRPSEHRGRKLQPLGAFCHQAAPPPSTRRVACRAQPAAGLHHHAGQRRFFVDHGRRWRSNAAGSKGNFVSRHRKLRPVTASLLILSHNLVESAVFNGGPAGGQNHLAPVRHLGNEVLKRKHGRVR
jgi:hypothetical protein